MFKSLIQADAKLASLRLATAVPFLILAFFTSRTIDALAPVYDHSWASFLSNMLGYAGATWFVAGVQVAIAVLLVAGLRSSALGKLGAVLLLVYGVVALTLYPAGKQAGNWPFLLKHVWDVGVALVLLQFEAVRNYQGTFTPAKLPALVLRLSVVLIFFLFSMGKWNLAGADGLVATYVGGTWLEFLPNLITAKGFSIYLGVFETAAWVLLLLGLFKPQAGVLGALLVTITGLVTVSLLPQLPYMTFIVKDLMLLGMGFYLAGYDYKRAHPAAFQSQLKQARMR